MPGVLEPPPTTEAPALSVRQQRLNEALQSVPPEQQKSIREAFSTGKYDSDGPQLRTFLESIPTSTQTRRDIWDAYWQYEPPAAPKTPAAPAEASTTDILKGSFAQVPGVIKDYVLKGAPAALFSATGVSIPEALVGPPQPPKPLPVPPSSPLGMNTQIPAPNTAVTLQGIEKPQIVVPTPIKEQKQLTIAGTYGNALVMSDGSQIAQQPYNLNVYKQYGVPELKPGDLAKLSGVEAPVNSSAPQPNPGPAGLVTPPTITNLFHRTELHNPDGSISTTSSKSFDMGDGNETLIPTVIGGKRLTDQEAITHYHQTGEHLGVFDTPEHADAFAQQLHDMQGEQLQKDAVPPPINPPGSHPPAPKEATTWEIIKGLPVAAAQHKAEADKHPGQDALNAYGTIVKGLAGVVTGATLNAYDVENGVLRVPITGQPLYQLRDRKLSDYLQDIGVSRDIATLGTADQIGQIVGTAVPWQKVSRAIASFVDITKVAALGKATQALETSPLAEDAMRVVKVSAPRSLVSIAQDILKDAGIQALTGATIQTLEATPKGEKPKDWAKTIGTSALYAAGLSVLVDAFLAIPEAVRSNQYGMAYKAAEKVRDALSDLLYKTGKYEDTATAQSAAEDILSNYASKNGGMPDKDWSEKTVDVIKDKTLTLEGLKQDEANSARGKLTPAAGGPGITVPEGGLPAPPPEPSEVAGPGFTAKPGPPPETTGNIPAEAAPAAETKPKLPADVTYVGPQPDADGNIAFHLYNLKLPEGGQATFAVKAGEDVAAKADLKRKEFAAAEAPKTEREAWKLITDAKGNPSMPAIDMVMHGFPVKDLVEQQGKSGFGYFYNEWKEKQGTAEAPKSPDVPKAVTPPVAVPKAATKPITVTDNSVRDHPQQVILKSDTITINNKVGNRKAEAPTAPMPKTYEEAQALMDDFDDALEKKYGKKAYIDLIRAQSERGIPEFENGKVPSGSRFKFTPEEMDENVRLLAQRDAFDETDVENNVLEIDKKFEPLIPDTAKRNQLVRKIAQADIPAFLRNENLSESWRGVGNLVNEIAHYVSKNVTHDRPETAFHVRAITGGTYDNIGIRLHLESESGLGPSRKTINETQRWLNHLYPENPPLMPGRDIPKALEKPKVATEGKPGSYSVRPTADGKFEVLTPQGEPFPRSPFDTQAEAQAFAGKKQARHEEMTGGAKSKPPVELVIKDLYGGGTETKTLPPVPSSKPAEPAPPSKSDVAKKALGTKPTASRLEELKARMEAAQQTTEPGAIDDFISEMRTTRPEYPKASSAVDGLTVRKDVPNLGSIRASFNDYKELPGIREVPFSAFPDYKPPVMSTQVSKLANQIKASKEINPLIVAVDKNGPYILEGGHRFDALISMGKTSFPAVVVMDMDDVPASEMPREPGERPTGPNKDTQQQSLARRQAAGAIYRSRIESAPKTASGYPVVATDGGASADLASQIAASPYVDAVAKALASSMNGLLPSGATVPEFGISLGEGHLGLNISGDYIGKDTNIVLINLQNNLWQAIQDLKRTDATPDDLALKASMNIADALQHELIHELDRTHGDLFDKEFKKAIARNKRALDDLTDKIDDILSRAYNAIHGDLNRLEKAWESSPDKGRNALVLDAGDDTPGRLRSPLDDTHGVGIDSGRGVRPGRVLPAGGRGPASFMGTSPGVPRSDAEIGDPSEDSASSTNALVRKHIENAPLAGVYPVINYDVNVPDSVRDQLASTEALAKIADDIGKQFYALRNNVAISKLGLGNPIFAISVKGSHLGVYLHGDLIGLRYSYVAINPYSIVEEILKEIHEGNIPAANGPNAVAKRIVLTIIHELAHGKYRNHDAKHTGLYGRMVDTLLEEINDAAKELRSTLEANDNEIYNGLERGYKQLQPYWGRGVVYGHTGPGIAGEAEHRVGAGDDGPRAIEGPGRRKTLPDGSGSETAEMATGSHLEPSDADIDDLDDATANDIIEFGGYQYQEHPDWPAWSQAMAELGDWVKPYLPSAFTLIDNVAAATGKQPAAKTPAKSELPPVPETAATGPRGPPENGPYSVEYGSRANGNQHEEFDTVAEASAFAAQQDKNPGNDFVTVTDNNQNEVDWEHLPSTLPKVPGGDTEVDGLVTRYRPLVDKLFDLFKSGESLNNERLRIIANEIFGGTRGQGNYNSKEAYDAAEVAINKVIEQPGFVDFNDIPRTLKRIESLQKQIPRQTDRTDEGTELQQFSTPPAEGLAVILATGLRPGMIGLEPSAGDGGMAIIGRLTGATILTNEIDPKRQAMLTILGFDPTSVDAQYLNNLLPVGFSPHVVFMNPPFSSTGGRTAGHNTKYGAEHVTQALARVMDGGRVVAIVGRGMAHGREGFDKWWQQIEQKYNVRANIGIDGKHYGKFGTGFDNQILVIDKTGPTPGTTRADKLLSITRAENLSPEQAIELLRNLGEEDILGRIEQLSQATKPKGEAPAREPVRGPEHRPPAAAPRPDLGGGQGGRLPAPPGTGSGLPAVGSVDAANNADAGVSDGGIGQGDGEGELSGTGKEGRTSTVGERDGDVDAGRDGGGHDLTLETSNPAAVGESESDLHNKYVIQKARFKGSVTHPADIVESAILASVEPPDVTYKPNLPEDVIKEGRISDVQLEAVVYAGQRHSQILPSGQRAGFWIGDGTGLGKGREAAAIIYDNFRQGRKKAVWFSVAHQLRVDAQRDLDGVGVPMKIIAQQDFKEADALPSKDGVLFTTYTLASQKFKAGKARFKQLAAWLGNDFDGVIIFDESHVMKNFLSTGVGGAVSSDNGTHTGAMGAELDQLLPNARIVYVSATAATVPRNMAYMGRLGLWGAGSPFPDFMDFLSAIGSGGVGAMEMLARDLKATGTYVSRLISYKGVEYGKITHTLTPEETDQYNRMADLWLTLQNAFAAALENSGAGHDARRRARYMSAFYSSQQRFFLQVMMGYQLPDLFASADADLAAGRSVIVSLYNTNEGQVKRKVAEAEAAGVDLDELDLTPRELIADLVRKSFPVTQHTTVRNPVTGRDETIEMTDENGNPIENRENAQKRDELLDSLSDVQVPENALDAIINHFGVKNVSEVSGRQKRLEGNKYVRRKIEGVHIKQRDATEVKRFQDGTVRAIVITGKASTGISLHSDTTAKNKQRRVFYAMQLSWSADKQMQSFGRPHRSSQEVAPIIKMVQTNLKGQERLTNTTAARLASLGAIQEGSRESKGGGLFASMDITDQYGESALMSMWRDAANNNVPGITSGRQLLTRMGVVDDQGNVKGSDMTDVDRFLNRILGLHVDEQNAMFEHFFALYQAGVENAKTHGTFDIGVEKIKASNIRMISKEEIHRHQSGAKTNLVELSGDFALSRYPWEKLDKDSKSERFLGMTRNKKSGKLYAAFGRTTLAGGIEVELYTPRNANNAGHMVTLGNYRDEFENVERPAAEKEWTAAHNALPSFETKPIHLISGAVFPIYDKVFEGSTYGHQVVQAIDTAGQPHLGIGMRPQEIPNLKHRLGIGTPLGQTPPSDIYKMVENRAIIVLDNGWEVKLTSVHGEPRIELDPKGNYNRDEMDRHGLISETIDYKRRYFVPMDAESGPEVLGSVLALHKAVRDKTSDSVQQPKPTAKKSKKPQISAGLPPAITPSSDDSAIPPAVSGPTAGQQFIAGGRSAQLPNVPKVLPQPPITIDGQTYEPATIKVQQRIGQTPQFKMTDVAGWQIAPGLAVTPVLHSPQEFNVTHSISGLSLGSPGTLDATVHMALRVAPLGDWTRSADDLLSDEAFKAAVQKKLSGEKGAVNFWKKAPPPKIALDQLKSKDQGIERLFDDPFPIQNIWQDLRAFPGAVYKFMSPLMYNADIKMWPVFAERVRRAQDLAVDASAKATKQIEWVLHGLDTSEFTATARLIYLEDLYETAAEYGEQAVPLPEDPATGLSVLDRLDGEINRLRSIATTPVLDAIDRWHQWMEQIHDDFVTRGKAEPGSGRVKYFPNYIRRFGDSMDNLPGLPYRMKEPKRLYLKQRKGHQQIHDSNFIRVAEQYGTRVYLHNAIDDFIQSTAAEYDLRNGTSSELPKLSSQELQQVLGQHKSVQPGNVYSLPDGMKFKAFQFNPGRVLYPVQAINNYTIQDALNAGLDELGIDLAALTQSLQQGRGLPDVPLVTTEGDPLTERRLTLGSQHKMYIVPIEIANKLERFRESNTPNPLTELARIWTKVFKMTALHFNVLTWQRQNILSNNIMLAVEDLHALGRQREALKLMRGKLTGPQYQTLLGLINDARIYNSSFVGSSSGTTRAINSPSLRKYRSQSTSLAGKLNPFGDNPIGDALRAYEHGLSMIEAIPKVAFFLENYDRVMNGLPVKAVGVSVGGLDPKSILAVGRTARELNGDYSAVSRNMKTIQGTLFTFSTWYIKIAPQVFRALKNTKHSYGVQVLIALSVASWLWNHFMYPETEAAMDWQKELLHVNLGMKDEQGNPYYWSLQTPLDAAEQGAGLHTLSANLDRVKSGEWTTEQMARQQLTDMFGFQNDSAWPWMTGAGSLLGKLLNPAIKASIDLAANRDSFTGQEIVSKSNPNLWGTLSHMSPDNPEGQKIRTAYFFKKIIVPYSQYLRAAQMDNPDSPVWNWITEGPLSWQKLLGIKSVNLDALQRAKWYDDKNWQQSLYDAKSTQIIALNHALDRKDITFQDYGSAMLKIFDAPGSTPTDTEIENMKARPSYQIQFLRDRLRLTTDTKERQDIESQIKVLSGQMDRDNYNSAPVRLRNTIGPPPTPKTLYPPQAP